MSDSLYAMQDPRKQYPGPPTDSEIQTAPATQQAMSEKPDCGETSYKGAGRLAGRKALLTGADSGIGRAAAIAFAREGADVAINYLPEEQADAEEVAQLVRGAGRKAILLPGDISQDASRHHLGQVNLPVPPEDLPQGPERQYRLDGHGAGGYNVQIKIERHRSSRPRR